MLNYGDWSYQMINLSIDNMNVVDKLMNVTYGQIKFN